MASAAGPDDRKGGEQCRRPSRSSNRTGPVVQTGLRPHARPTWDPQRPDRTGPRAGGRGQCRVILAATVSQRSVHVQSAIAHRHPCVLSARCLTSCSSSRVRTAVGAKRWFNLIWPGSLRGSIKSNIQEATIKLVYHALHFPSCHSTPSQLPSSRQNRLQHFFFKFWQRILLSWLYFCLCKLRCLGTGSEHQAFFRNFIIPTFAIRKLLMEGYPKALNHRTSQTAFF